ncbi:hypothetical protein AZF00_14485 [Zhongshania aliphaticivorans]|uniref:Uncharacterized protein n=1 Tax=Zhongshania aliphaticivorans TaxID=1470434 RepID=A0A127M891_9GAMM|nr:hypothetical protein AZF00_14485 [Zhongshania aliphaticivorans]
MEINVTLWADADINCHVWSASVLLVCAFKYVVINHYAFNLLFFICLIFILLSEGCLVQVLHRNAQ